MEDPQTQRNASRVGGCIALKRQKWHAMHGRHPRCANSSLTKGDHLHQHPAGLTEIADIAEACAHADDKAEPEEPTVAGHQTLAQSQIRQGIMRSISVGFQPTSPVVLSPAGLLQVHQPQLPVSYSNPSAHVSNDVQCHHMPLNTVWQIEPAKTHTCGMIVSALTKYSQTSQHTSTVCMASYHTL